MTVGYFPADWETGSQQDYLKFVHRHPLMCLQVIYDAKAAPDRAYSYRVDTALEGGGI